ncbi:hypothetical protein AVEN_32671-1 [Araneus ventricosus]|uniref:Uncharacterized protein n=1 Tax=Araneus ventricosus TaxID=182803 RepID=A0A4Y2C7I8_ARAVE|nr:hypothetical protein AVEN_32671-1 [Araneus ventricosus]
MEVAVHLYSGVYFGTRESQVGNLFPTNAALRFVDGSTPPYSWGVYYSIPEKPVPTTNAAGCGMDVVGNLFPYQCCWLRYGRGSTPLTLGCLLWYQRVTGVRVRILPGINYARGPSVY